MCSAPYDLAKLTHKPSHGTSTKRAQSMWVLHIGGTAGRVRTHRIHQPPMRGSRFFCQVLTTDAADLYRVGQTETQSVNWAKQHVDCGLPVDFGYQVCPSFSEGTVAQGYAPSLRAEHFEVSAALYLKSDVKSVVS